MKKTAGGQDPFDCDIRTDDPFMVFYAFHLVRSPGSRLQASMLREDYLTWASYSDMPSVSFRSIKEAMERIGHVAVKSNGIKFNDVASLGTPRPVEDAVTVFHTIKGPRLAPVEIDRLTLIERRLDRLESFARWIRQIVVKAKLDRPAR